ncbi:hypothetical protein [Streptomyces sp. NPDC052107]|uniref:hypothetical protein n=1 Tax=Streptomyces sp. NPDC052107 TaxID=3155632 RepID=UPI0034148EBF
MESLVTGAAEPIARAWRLPNKLAVLMLLLAIAAPLYGMVYDINGATQAGADVGVIVQVRAVDRLEISLPDHAITAAQAEGVAGHETQHALRQYDPDPTGHSLRLGVPGARGATWLDADLPTVTLRSWGSTVPEQILARGGTAVITVCVGVGAFLLYRILQSIAAGRPFESGNPRRIAGLAGAIWVAGVVPGVLTSAAASLVLRRVGLAGPHSPVMAPPLNLIGSMVGNLLLPLLVLAFAEAFRRGGELARDVEGLV